jgi:hypothetical protein
MGQWEINNNNPSNPFDQNSKHFWVNGKKKLHIFPTTPQKIEQSLHAKNNFFIQRKN